MTNTINILLKSMEATGSREALKAWVEDNEAYIEKLSDKDKSFMRLAYKLHMKRLK